MMAADSDDDVILNEQIEIIEIEETDDDDSGDTNNLSASKTVKQPQAVPTNRQIVTGNCNQFVFGKAAKRIPLYRDTVERICKYFQVRFEPEWSLQDIRKQFKERTKMRKKTHELRKAIALNAHCWCRGLLVNGLPRWFDMYHMITLLRLMSSFNVNKPYYYINMTNNKRNRSTNTVGCDIRFLDIEDCRQVLYDMQGIQYYGNEITAEVDMSVFYKGFKENRTKKTLERMKVFRQKQLNWIPDMDGAIEIYDSQENPDESYYYPLLVDIKKNFKTWYDPVDEIIEQIEKESSAGKEKNASRSEACTNKNDKDLNSKNGGENTVAPILKNGEDHLAFSSKNGENKFAWNSNNEELKNNNSKHDDDKLQGEDGKLTFNRKLTEDGKKSRVWPSVSTSAVHHPYSWQSVAKATRHPNVNQNRVVNLPKGYAISQPLLGNQPQRNYNPNPYFAPNNYNQNSYFAPNNSYQNRYYAPNGYNQNPNYAPNGYNQNPNYAPNGYNQNPNYAPNTQYRPRVLNPVAPNGYYPNWPIPISEHYSNTNANKGNKRRAGKPPVQNKSGKRNRPSIKCEKGDQPDRKENIVIKKEVAIRTDYQDSQISDIREQKPKIQDIVIKKEPADFQGDRFQQECSKIKQNIKKECDF